MTKLSGEKFRVNLTKGQHKQLLRGIKEIGELADSGHAGGFFAQIWANDEYGFIEAVVLPKNKALKIQKIAGTYKETK